MLNWGIPQAFNTEHFNLFQLNTFKPILVHTLWLILVQTVQVRSKSEPLKIILEAQYRPSQDAMVVEVLHMQAAAT